MDRPHIECRRPGALRWGLFSWPLSRLFFLGLIFQPKIFYFSYDSRNLITASHFPNQTFSKSNEAQSNINSSDLT